MVFDRNKHEDFANVVYAGRDASAIIEDNIDDKLTEMLGESTLSSLGFDSYDNSIELYFEENTPSDFKANESLRDLIFSFGFDCCWLNFTDGTEQIIRPDFIGERISGPGKGWNPEEK